jgi:hypothetical protein
MKALVKGEVCPTAEATLAPRELGALYADALEADLRLASEAALPGAYEIGRSAMARDIGQLEMATMHHEALARALQGAAGPASLEEELQRAGDFFTETLSPYDMAYRGFRDAMSALHQLNQTMEREIQRIAHTVHDEAGPLLDAARLAMSAASQAMSPAVQKSLREVSAILDRADEELRRLSHELRRRSSTIWVCCRHCSFSPIASRRRARSPSRSRATLNGLDAARELQKSLSKTKTILLTRHGESQYVTGALRAGACDWRTWRRRSISKREWPT